MVFYLVLYLSVSGDGVVGHWRQQAYPALAAPAAIGDIATPNVCSIIILFVLPAARLDFQIVVVHSGATGSSCGAKSH